VFQANTTAGFSIVTFAADNTAGRVVAHGLGVAPKMIITKGTAQTTGWYTYHFNIGANKFIRLNETNSEATNTGIWGNTHPTSSVFTIGNNECGYNSGGANDVLAYCFAEVEGYSKMGSYITNAANSGPFVHTGFRPAFVMVKVTGGGSNASYWSWTIYDNKRVPFNTNHSPLFANLAVIENFRGDGSTNSGGNTLYFDFLSNGFKVMNGGTEANGTAGSPVVYMAFAEMPFKYANAK